MVPAQKGWYAVMTSEVEHLTVLGLNRAKINSITRLGISPPVWGISPSRFMFALV